jgi:chemotaxis protein MotB
MAMRGWRWAGVALLVAPGCLVSQSKYDALQAEYDEYKTAAEKREQGLQATIQSLEDAIRAERVKVADLEKQLEVLRAEKVALATDKTRMMATESQLIAALKELEERKVAAEKRIAEYRELLSRFKALIDSGKLRVRIIDGQMIVELATDVLFPSGSAVLSAEGKAAVVEVTQVLASIQGKKYQVAGHTDNVPIRTSKYPSNWYLAFDRAHSVLQAMVESGMPLNRVNAASNGEFRPTAGNDTDEARAKNRRIDIIVVPDLSELPGAEELQKLDPASGKGS